MGYAPFELNLNSAELDYKQIKMEAMVTRKDLSDFAEFCQVKYQIKLSPVIVEDFFQNEIAGSKFKEENRNLSEHELVQGCSSNNIDCTHLTFDSVKCNECPY